MTIRVWALTSVYNGESYLAAALEGQFRDFIPQDAETMMVLDDGLQYSANDWRGAVICGRYRSRPSDDPLGFSALSG